MRHSGSKVHLSPCELSKGDIANPKRRASLTPRSSFGRAGMKVLQGAAALGSTRSGLEREYTRRKHASTLRTEFIEGTRTSEERI